MILMNSAALAHPALIWALLCLAVMIGAYLADGVACVADRDADAGQNGLADSASGRVNHAVAKAGRGSVTGPRGRDDGCFSQVSEAVDRDFGDRPIKPALDVAG